MRNCARYEGSKSDCVGYEGWCEASVMDEGAYESGGEG